MNTLCFPISHCEASVHAAKTKLCTNFACVWMQFARLFCATENCAKQLFCHIGFIHDLCCWFVARSKHVLHEHWCTSMIRKITCQPAANYISAGNKLIFWYYHAQNVWRKIHLSYSRRKYSTHIQFQVCPNPMPNAKMGHWFFFSRYWYCFWLEFCSNSKTFKTICETQFKCPTY